MRRNGDDMVVKKGSLYWDLGWFHIFLHFLDEPQHFSLFLTSFSGLFVQVLILAVSGVEKSVFSYLGVSDLLTYGFVNLRFF